MTRQPRLIIVCGLPGAGKTIHAKRLAADVGAIRFCPDEWMEALGINLWDAPARSRIEALQWELAQQLLCLSQTAIIEWGTWAREERDTLREGARRLGAAVELHYLDAPVDVLWERIDKRGLEDPPMRLSDLEADARKFQRPTSEELELYDETHRAD